MKSILILLKKFYSMTDYEEVELLETGEGSTKKPIITEHLANGADFDVRTELV